MARCASGILGLSAEDFRAAWRSGVGKQSPSASRGLELCLEGQELPKKSVREALLQMKEQDLGSNAQLGAVAEGCWAGWCKNWWF